MKQNYERKNVFKKNSRKENSCSNKINEYSDLFPKKQKSGIYSLE